jgi:hypothetical protein
MDVSKKYKGDASAEKLIKSIQRRRRCMGFHAMPANDAAGETTREEIGCFHYGSGQVIVTGFVLKKAGASRFCIHEIPAAN